MYRRTRKYEQRRKWRPRLEVPADEQRPAPWRPPELRRRITIEDFDGRDPHDHPWPFITLLLDNAYIEHRPGRAPRLYRAGSILFRRASTWHHLELLPEVSLLPPVLSSGRIREQPVTTLFLQFPVRQKWGFLKDGRKVYYRDYFAQREAEERAERAQQGT